MMVGTSPQFIFGDDSDSNEFPCLDETVEITSCHAGVQVKPVGGDEISQSHRVRDVQDEAVALLIYHTSLPG